MKNKLPKAFKKKWITALRSGKYKQGRGGMYSKLHKEFCCLGVAEMICGNSTENIAGYCSSFDLSESKVPKILQINPYSSINNLVRKLILFNDSRRLSFEWIASYIERYL